MKVLSTEEIREADRATIASESISASDLMDQAAMACLPLIFKWLSNRNHLLIVCGPGNNGGDGLVIAKHVAMTGKKVWLITDPGYSGCSPLFIQKKNDLVQQHLATFLTWQEFDGLSLNPEDVVLIDALLGTGLSRSPEGFVKDSIERINRMKMPVISIDVPSGCPGDEGFIPSGNHVCVHADLTLSFEFPRISFFMPQWRAFCGEIKILPIGLHEPQGIKHHYHYVDLEFCRSLYMKRNPYGHKGSFGHLFLAAGSLRYSGAALLACKAAVCSGVGLLSAFVPGALKQTLNGYCPEAIVFTSEDDQVVAGSPALDAFHAVAVGPGLGMEAMTEKFLKNLIGSCRNAMVIDADALNILSENPTWLAFLPPLTILTPHPGEFERLAGKSAEGMERWKLAREFASKWNVILVLKGFNTMVVFPGGRIFFNASGNSGMAKGGSGDVLTGLIGGLLAQGYRAEDAAILGVYIHGLAGDIAEEQLGQHAMSASDLIHFFSEAFARVSA